MQPPTSYYSIRPVYWEQLVLFANSTSDEINAEIKRKNVTEDTLTSLLANEQWQIYYQNSGLVIKNRGTSKCLTVSGSSVSAGGSLALGDYNSSNTTFRWTISSVSSLPKRAFLYDTYWQQKVTVNTVKCADVTDPPNAVSLSDNNLVIQICGGTSANTNITWTSSNPSIASVDANTGAVTGHHYGTAVITAECTIGSETVNLQYTIAATRQISVINVYDSSVNDGLLGFIPSAVEFLNLIFPEQFKLHFVMDGAPILYNDTKISECSNGANESCTIDECGDTCALHHKSVTRIARDLQQYFENDHVVVKWSNQREEFYCSDQSLDTEENGSHIAVGWLGCTVPGDLPYEILPVAQILHITDSSDTYTEADKILMSLVLAHEIAHTIGMPEIYTEMYTNDNKPTGWHEHLGTEIQINENGTEDTNAMLCIMDSFANAATFEDEKYKNNSDYGKPAFDDPAGYLYNSIIEGTSNGLCEYCRGKTPFYDVDTVFIGEPQDDAEEDTEG